MLSTQKPSRACLLPITISKGKRVVDGETSTVPTLGSAIFFLLRLPRFIHLHLIMVFVPLWSVAVVDFEGASTFVNTVVALLLAHMGGDFGFSQAHLLTRVNVSHETINAVSAILVQARTRSQRLALEGE